MIKSQLEASYEALLSTEAWRSFEPRDGVADGHHPRDACAELAAAMLAAAAERWQVECERDDEADALWIAETGRQMIGGEA